MKTIIINNNNLTEEDIEKEIIKVKALIKNDEKTFLISSNNFLQLPGGTLNDNESLIDGLKREVREEVGIELDGEYEPFFHIKRYFKKWPKTGRNKIIHIYYYFIETNKVPDKSKIKLSEREKLKDFKVVELSYNNLEDEIKANIEKYGDNKDIGKEMLEMLKYI